MFLLSRTFSHHAASHLLKDIEDISRGAATYVENIPVERWQGTAWLDNPRLPPRFGITTTNMSESANYMIEKARDGSWLFTIDYILSYMTEKICKSRKKREGKEGVVAYLVHDIKQQWSKCAGYKILEVDSTGYEFTVVRSKTEAAKAQKKYTIDIAN